MRNTYHVEGVLEKTDPDKESNPLPPQARPIDEEIEAPHVLAAMDSFEVDGWEWVGGK